jgi:hypothetical protein
MTYDDDTLYKCLNGNKSCHGGSGKWTPGRWRYVPGEVVACEHGIHYCKGKQVLNWLSPDLWVFEDGGTKHDDQDDKYVTNRGRITERIDAWNEEVARLFAVDCARAVIRYARDDQRELLHACLDISTGYALGLVDEAAQSAAQSAVQSAAASAASSAAQSAAAIATQSATHSAAWSAAWSAVHSATWSATASATWSAVRGEQYSLLCRYLNGEQGPFVEEGTQ